MTRTPTTEVNERRLSVVLPYRTACRQPSNSRLTVRTLDGHDELAIEEARENRQNAARIASRLIGRCALGDEGPIGVEEARTLSVGDREIVLRHIYAATFSNLIEAQVECGAGCGEIVCFELDLAALAKEPAEAGPHHRIRLGRRLVDCRVPNGGDIEDAASAGPEGGARLALACVDGKRCDFDALALAVARLDPNADCEIALKCPNCDREFSAWLDGLELIQRQVRAQGGILAQIDRLAAAYGWAEADILALPRHRRLRYCAMVEARAT